MKKMMIFWCFLSLSALGAQAQVEVDSESSQKAAEWVLSLNLADQAKEERVKGIIATHLSEVKNWHNTHPSSSVPAGINPVTGNRLSDLDKQIIADSAMPSTVHQALMEGLKKELSQAQIEIILDRYTIGKVAFTLKGYQAIVPDLTTDEEAKILTFLKQAREQAVDFKNMKQISAIFEIYKTKCEQMLNHNGRNWRELYSAYTKKIKEEKEKNKQ